MTAPAPSAGRAAYDPFAPSAGYAFPERRLRRAGLEDATVSRLADEFLRASAEERRELVRFVTRSPDSRIAARYQGTRSRAELEALRVDDLLPLLRERHLSTDGRKADFVSRLLESYEAGVQEQPTRAPQEAAAAPQPPAPAAGTPEVPEPVSGEQGGQTAPTPETVTGTNPAPEVITEAPQTPDAAPAPDTAAPADTTTTEE